MLLGRVPEALRSQLGSRAEWSSGRLREAGLAREGGWMRWGPACSPGAQSLPPGPRLKHPHLRGLGELWSLTRKGLLSTCADRVELGVSGGWVLGLLCPVALAASGLRS